MPTIACCVPARLASKRVPRKNVLEVAGRPLIAWTIAAARESGLFDAVHVCTESEEIAAVAEREGAVAHLVAVELCGDLVPSWKPCLPTARQLRAEAMLCLQPTSPLRSAEDIRRAVEHFNTAATDFLVSVTPIDPHYFHWALEQHGGGRFAMCFGDAYLQERELLPPRYRPNGSIKLARLDALEREGSFFGPSLTAVETPEERSVHVGVELELRLADLLLREREA